MSLDNASAVYFRDTSFLNPLWLPCDDCCADRWFWREEAEDEKDAYIACWSRGDWWNEANALGDVAPVGKNPYVGEGGTAG